jgi:hypothetical protein
MGNSIKIPLLGTLDKVGGDAATITNWDISALTVTASATSGSLESVSSGAGSEAKFTFSSDAASAVSVVVDVAGKDYSAGQTITVTIPSANAINGGATDVDVTLLLEDNMIAGGAFEGYILLPSSGLLACVIPDTASYTTWKIQQLENDHTRPWTIEIQGGLVSNYVDITKRINNVLVEACTSPNSQPSLVLPEGVFATDLFIG